MVVVGVGEKEGVRGVLETEEGRRWGRELRTEREDGVCMVGWGGGG